MYYNIYAKDCQGGVQSDLSGFSELGASFPFPSGEGGTNGDG